MKIFERISMIMFALVIIISLFVGYIRDTEANEKNYAVIGQSNAYYMANTPVLKNTLSTPETRVNIINCSHPGQKVKMFTASWLETTYFGNCLHQIGNRKLDGIIFWQGESDTKLIFDANRWPIIARGILVSLRVETDSGNIPIVMIALNNLSHPLGPYWKDIRGYQISMVAPNLHKLDSSNYQFRPDNVHLLNYDAIAIDAAKLLSENQIIRP